MRVVDRLRMVKAWLDRSPSELARQADEALAEGDKDLCIALIETIYDLVDRLDSFTSAAA